MLHTPRHGNEGTLENATTAKFDADDVFTLWRLDSQTNPTGINF